MFQEGGSYERFVRLLRARFALGRALHTAAGTERRIIGVTLRAVDEELAKVDSRSYLARFAREEGVVG